MRRLLHPMRPLNGLLLFGMAAAAAIPLGGHGTAASAAVQADSSIDSDVAAFYRARGGAPLWLAPTSGAAAQQLLSLLASAGADRLNPRRYDVRGLGRALEEARGNPAAAERADMMLSEAFVEYARDQKHDPGGIIYLDRELRPTPPAPAELLAAAARAPSLSDYVQNMAWMNPIYAKLRAAIASRMYSSDAQRRILELNLERARALPSGNGRYVLVNPPAARLYMYENGQVVDSMRVVAGRPDQVAQTPMMNAFIRYVALNPYWNSPADLTSKLLAPRVLKGGRAYINQHGYEVLSDWGPNAHLIDPMSVDWRAVAAGKPIRMRQKPGPANSMGRMKFMFPNPQGIWLHDTPEKEKIEDAARLQSNGCVRLEDASRLERWLFNGRPPSWKGAKPEQKVNLPQPVPLYITYLTAVPSGTSIVYFADFYGKDRAEVRRFAGIF